MGAFEGMQIAASGLTAQRFRMDVIASNLANANTTRTPQGGPFRREMVVFQARAGAVPGVRVVGLKNDMTPFQRIYNPGSPDADAKGYVLMPNVNPVLEMTDMISASRSYEAGITTIDAFKGMDQKAIEI